MITKYKFFEKSAKIVGMLMLLCLWEVNAFAYDGVIEVGCPPANKPKPITAPDRSKGDKDTWTFQVKGIGDAQLKNPIWTYTPTGPAESWGTWIVDGLKLTWIAPAAGLQQPGAFHVGIKGKIAGCGGQGAGGPGGGEEPDFDVSWDGNVVLPKLTIGGLDDAQKINIGGLVVRNFDGNNAPRKAITIEKAEPNTWKGKVTLTKNSAKIKVFTAAIGGTEITFNGTANKFANTALPKTFYVEGVTASDSMRDVELKIIPEGAVGEDTAKFTVLWVDQPTVATTGTVSTDNDKRDLYKSATVSNTYNLDIQRYNALVGSRMGWGTEASATVHPGDFSYPLITAPSLRLKLERDFNFHDWVGNGASTINQASYNAIIPPGQDTSPEQFRDDNPSPNGVIYDLDAPGLPLAPPGALNVTHRTRNNFKSFASITIDGTVIRCSLAREYFIRFSMTYANSVIGPDWNVITPPDVIGDRQAGNGTTPLSWNLQ